MRIENILGGIDFEKDTEKVLAYASFFAKSFSASLTLLHVIDYLMTPPSYLIPYIEEEKRAAEKKFDILKRELQASRLQVGTMAVVGRLQESFCDAVKNTKSDMVVLGFISHIVRRSSSEKLIKSLRIPILIVRGDKSESSLRVIPLRIGKILCPTDFSEISGRALNAARELAERFSAQLEILHVFPNHMFEQMKTVRDRDSLLKELRDEAMEKLGKFIHSSGLTKAGEMVEGEPDERIVSFAKEKDVDLIVIGARGLGLLQGMLIGSVTDAVLKTSPCPVLVIH
jgi:nucleotide-binding universal stress UspA family protein